jgi:glycogen debranching enzyme
VVRKTGDLKLLRRWLPAIERLAALIEETDEDGDGLMETVKSTHGGGWYDVVQNKNKCAYGNALAYRAFGYAADLERLAGNKKQAAHYAQVAGRIRAAYLPTFLNPATGIVCGWRTKDGVYHDYWFPWINGMAISLGLVPEPQANAILDRLQAKFKQVGFDRFDLGMPNCLEPIAPADYVKNEKGEQLNPFKTYLNGGVAPCYCYHYLQALYRLGRRAEADAILWSMVRQFEAGRFNGGAEAKRILPIDPVTGKAAPANREWSDWNGKPQTGEGFLPDSYHVLNVLWTGYYGIGFGPEGYRLEPWSLLQGPLPKLGLKYMGKIY